MHTLKSILGNIFYVPFFSDLIQNSLNAEELYSLYLDKAIIYETHFCFWACSDYTQKHTHISQGTNSQSNHFTIYGVNTKEYIIPLL